MRSLALLQALLVLFVLIPAGVLGWLGLKAADGYEATTREAYQREVLAVAETLRRMAPEVLAQEAQDSADRLRAAAGLLLARLPFEQPAQALAAAQAALALGGTRGFDDGWRADQVRLRIVDSGGRGLFPRELVAEPEASTTDRERLLAELRRSADVALFGQGDPAAAAAVWSRARERAREASLLASIDAEAAWSDLRQATSAEAFARSVDRLELEHGPEGMRAAGRTWALLLLRAGDEVRLTRLAREGWLVGVPLTQLERERLDDLLAPAGRPAPRLETLEWPLRHGASLHVVRPDASGAVVLARLRALVRELGLPIRLGEARLATIAPLTWPAATDAVVHQIEIPRAGRMGLAYVLEHGGIDRLRTDVARRRLWTTIAVASLLAVVVLGLFLTRRTVLREREAVRLRDDFLANVSHELRTPLTSVSLHADLLARADLGPEKRRAYVEVVRAEGARLSSLVEDLLDFAALERGARRLAPEPMAVLPAVERALLPYRVLAEQAGVVLTLDLAPPAPREVEALADPHAVGRILANLVGNAFQHGTPTRDGGPPCVRVRVGASPGRVLVEVRDNGPGVPAEERAHLFERFRRGRAAGARPGTGLGLALSRGLARAMAGDLVWAEQQGETIFRLTLPAFDAGAVPGATSPAGPSPATLESDGEVGA